MVFITSSANNKKRMISLKKRIANAVELFLLVVSFVIMCMNSITKVSIGSWASPYKTSLLNCISEDIIKFIPMCVLFGICAVMCIISIVSKNTDKDGKAHIAVAVILFISATYNTISCTIGDEFISFDFPFTVLIAIWFAIVVVAITKRSSLIAGSENKETVFNNVIENTSADELKKYKNLLDSGAITQEEYNEKKKQLLNL